MAHSGRNAAVEGGLYMLAYGIALFVAMLVIAVAVRCYQDRGDDPLDAQLRMAESKLSDLAFAYRCPECESTLMTDWHVGDIRCTVCNKLRQFVGVTVWDAHTSRGVNDRPNKPGHYSTVSIPREPPVLNCLCPPACECCSFDGGECFCRKAVAILDDRTKRTACEVAELQLRTAVVETALEVCQ
jgi:hypothetical protein